MIRVGIAGLGTMGTIHSRAYALLPTTARIVAGADLETDRRERFGAVHDVPVYTDYRAMLTSETLDVMDICVPTYLHAEAVSDAAFAGKHILCEKPMALSVAQCDAMIDAAAHAGVTLMIAQVLRFWPEYITIKEIVDSGKYGVVKWLRAYRGGGRPLWSWQDWYSDPDRSGGAALDVHIHDLDIIRWMLGRPKFVSATGTPPNPNGADATFTTLTGFPDGSVALADATWTIGSAPFGSALTVEFEHATVSISASSPTGVVVNPASGGAEYPEVRRPEVTGRMAAVGNVEEFGGYFAEVQYFLDCLEQGIAPDRCPPADSRQAVALCHAARQSLELGRPVAV